MAPNRTLLFGSTATLLVADRMAITCFVSISPRTWRRLKTISWLSAWYIFKLETFLHGSTDTSRTTRPIRPDGILEVARTAMYG